MDRRCFSCHCRIRQPSKNIFSFILSPLHTYTLIYANKFEITVKNYFLDDKLPCYTSDLPISGKLTITGPPVRDWVEVEGEMKREMFMKI